MSQFLTINKLSGHVFVNQGVFVVKVIINSNNIIKLTNVIFLIMKITVPETSTDTGETLSLTTNALLLVTMSPRSSGGYSGVLIQSRNCAVMGTILESENAAVSTFGRQLPLHGFPNRKTVNLVNLLTRLIMVAWQYILTIIALILCR